MKLRVLDILAEKGKTKYWLYIQLGLSYQNFNKIECHASLFYVNKKRRKCYTETRYNASYKVVRFV